MKEEVKKALHRNAKVQQEKRVLSNPVNEAIVLLAEAIEGDRVGDIQLRGEVIKILDNQ